MTNANQVNIKGTNYAVLEGQANIGDCFGSNIVNISKGQTNINNEGTNYNIVDFPKRLCDLKIGDIVYIDLEADYGEEYSKVGDIPNFTFNHETYEYYKIKNADLTYDLYERNFNRKSTSLIATNIGDGKISTAFIVVNKGTPEHMYDKDFEDRYENTDGVWLLSKDIYKLSKMGISNSYVGSRISQFLNTDFLNRMDNKVSEAIMTVGKSNYYHETKNTSNDYIKPSYLKVFLPSALEYNFTPQQGFHISNNKITSQELTGQPLQYFKQGGDSMSPKFYSTTINFFTSSIIVGGDDDIITFNGMKPNNNSNGMNFSYRDSVDTFGIRPAFVLPNNFLVQQKPEKSGYEPLGITQQQEEDDENIIIKFNPHPSQPGLNSDFKITFPISDDNLTDSLYAYIWQSRNSTTITVKKNNNITIYYDNKSTFWFLGYKLNGNLVENSSTSFSFEAQNDIVISMEYDKDQPQKFYLNIETLPEEGEM